MKTNNIFLAVFLSLLIVGCANFNSVHRDLNISKGNGALIDIKQRAIIASVITTTKDTKTTSETRVCAEPSPDSLSAYAAELAAKADNSHVSASISAAFQEGSAFVGLRTQSIQLLRDASYRLCESYLNGAIEKEEYGWLMRRFQRNMLVLLAVEQLTGTVHTPTVTVGSESPSSTAHSLTELRAEQERIDARLKLLDEANIKLATDTQNTPANADKNKIAADKNTSIITQLKSDKKSVEDAIANNLNILTSGHTSVSVYNFSPQNTEKSDTQIVKIADTVRELVNRIIDQDDIGTLCFTYLKSKQGEVDSKDQLATSCIANIGSAGIRTSLQEASETAKQPTVPDLQLKPPKAQINAHKSKGVKK